MQQSLKKQTLMYSAGAILNKLQAFMLLPVMTRYLSPDDYGILEILITLSAFVTIFSIFNLDSGLSTYYHEQVNEKSRAIVASSSIWLNNITVVTLTPFFIFYAPQISQMLFQDTRYSFLVSIISIVSILSGTMNLHTTLLRLKFQVWRYNVLLVGGSLVLFFVSLWFVAGLRWGITGVVCANLIVRAITVLIALLFSRVEFFTRPNKMWMFTLIKVSIPLLPFSLASWALASIDRTFLVAYRSFEEIGLYGVSVRFASVISVILSSFQTAWWPFATAIWKKSDAKEIYIRVLGAFVAFGGIFVILLGLISPLIIDLLIPVNYQEASRYVGLLAVSNFLTTLYFFPLISLILCKKTWIVSVAYGIGAAINIVLNFILIPHYGVLGAVGTTLIGYIVMITIAFIWSHNLLPINYPYGKVAIALFVLIGLTSLAYFYPIRTSWIVIGQTIFGCITYLTICLFFGLIEIKTILEISANFRSRFSNVMDNILK